MMKVLCKNTRGDNEKTKKEESKKIKVKDKNKRWIHSQSKFHL
jgi:hypothetical protein